MSEIAMRHLQTKFLVVPSTISLGHLLTGLEQIPTGQRADWYVVVRLDAGGLAAFDLQDLAQTVADQPEVNRDRPLTAFPELVIASDTAERQGQGIGQARRLMRRSHKRRLVVLEDGEPVGLLVDVARAGGWGGIMTTLFGEEQERYNVSEAPVKVRCPVDGAFFNLADIIDLQTGALVCPNGHVIER
jgi:hypothetical protein